MKLAQVKVKLFSETSAANLETAVNSFLAVSGERTFLDIAFQVIAGAYNALLTYME